MPLFKSTRGGTERVTFEQAILSGYAPDGGLFVPESLPTITHTELHQWKHKSFPDICALVLSKIIQTEIPLPVLNQITSAAFATFEQHNGSPLPLVRVSSAAPHLSFLETFHGPTLAFKDIGLQVLARLVNYFLKKKNGHATILMETSGDTGPAALSAAANLNNLEMYCLYPKDRVSRVQELQCTTASLLANNLHVYRTEGTTDDQAATIKALFQDRAFVEQYHCCSMNSINVGRIATQSSYYVYTYLQAVEHVGDPIDFAIPTGAFGNALGGYWSKKMGLPIRSLIIATNANDICHRAIASGDFSPQLSVATVSPAMDIQLPYNFERFLHCLLDGSNGKGGRASRELTPLLAIQPDGSRRLPLSIVNQIKAEGIVSIRVNDADTLRTVQRYWEKEQYVLDPHSAIGVLAAEKYLQTQSKHQKKGTHAVQCVAVLTAHPSKFEEATKQAIGTVLESRIPARVQILDTLKQKYDTRLGPPKGRATLGGSAIPEWIQILKNDIIQRDVARTLELERRRRTASKATSKL